MTVYDAMTFDLLQRAKVARDDLHIIVGQLASQYGIEQRYVEEKLTELRRVSTSFRQVLTEFSDFFVWLVTGRYSPFLGQRFSLEVAAWRRSPSLSFFLLVLIPGFHRKISR